MADQIVKGIVIFSNISVESFLPFFIKVLQAVSFGNYMWNWCVMQKLTIHSRQAIILSLRWNKILEIVLKMYTMGEVTEA